MSIIPLVFDHQDFVVVNKPVGVPMHDPELGICQLLSRQLGGAKVFLIHRLDTDTSGCLLLAKNAQAAAVLSGLFAQRKMNKIYLALTDQKPKKKQGKITGDMQKSRDGNYKLTQSQHSPAVTFFKSVFFSSASCKNPLLQNHRLFYLKPISGKTHQLRVALKSLGSPILGDKRYKGTPSDRLYLHSYSLTFDYLGEHFEISCLPESGERFVNLLEAPLRHANELEWPKYQYPQPPANAIQNSNINSSPDKLN